MNGLEVGTDNADLPTHTPLTSMYSVFVTRERNVSVREGRVAGERETLQGDGEREREREREKEKERKRDTDSAVERWNVGEWQCLSGRRSFESRTHGFSHSFPLFFSPPFLSLSLSFFIHSCLPIRLSVHLSSILSLSLSLFFNHLTSPPSHPLLILLYIYIYIFYTRVFARTLFLFLSSFSLCLSFNIHIYISLDGSTLPFLVLSLLVGTPVSGRRRGAT